MLGVKGSTGIFRECQAVLYLFNYLFMYLFFYPFIYLFIYLLISNVQPGWPSSAESWFNFLSMMRKGIDVTVVQGPSPTCSALDATFITEIC